MNRNTIKKWKETKELLDTAKKEEAKLRKEICAHYFEDKVGNFKVKDEVKVAGEDFQLVATSKTKVTVDREVLKFIWEDLSDEEREVFRWKPEVNKTAYNKMKDKADEDTKVFDVLKESEAMPTLELKSI